MKTRSIKTVSLAMCTLMLVAFSGRDYEHLLGTKAPAWTVSHWINTESMDLADLRGKVVLVRWWTGPHCPFCRASAAALNEWYQTYKDGGLVVVGLYHHKSPSPKVAQDEPRHYLRTKPTATSFHAVLCHLRCSS